MTTKEWKLHETTRVLVLGHGKCIIGGGYIASAPALMIAPAAEAKPVGTLVDGRDAVVPPDGVVIVLANLDGALALLNTAEAAVKLYEEEVWRQVAKDGSPAA